MRKSISPSFDAWFSSVAQGSRWQAKVNLRNVRSHLQNIMGLTEPNPTLLAAITTAADSSESYFRSQSQSLVDNPKNHEALADLAVLRFELLNSRPNELARLIGLD